MGSDQALVVLDRGLIVGKGFTLSTAAVQGVNDGLKQAGTAANYVKGLAIYADWTTDDTEWSDFQKAWVANK